jgi:calcyphosin
MTFEDLVNEIKSKLSGRGVLGIRSLSRIFKILDNNGNKQIDIEELYWGLKDFGINISEEEAQNVLSGFDRDRNGTLNFDEFLRGIRGDINDFRVSWIRKAYQKLDVNGDGLVKLDDIA